MRILVMGYGKIGRTIADLLHSAERYQISIAESNSTALAQAATQGLTTHVVDVTDAASMARALTNQDIVVNALPHFLNERLAKAAVQAGVHYFDLSEDVATTKLAKELAQSARTALMPQCGLAPGFIAVAAYDLAKRFDTLENVMCRVGALPVYPTNALKYNLTWSTDGLINEYCMPCEVILDNERREVLPLEGLETFSLDGVEYECFNTSGGIGSLCDTLLGKAKSVTYKTIRYPGHCALARVLINELKLGNKRQILRDILEDAIPTTLQDKVIVFASVTGRKDGRLVQDTFTRTIYSQNYIGQQRSAIQIATAAGICSAIELFCNGRLPQRGFIRQEDMQLEDVLATRFGQVYSG